MKVAVAIALYNGERYIDKQLDSIRKQSRIPDKVILCDDQSTDETMQIVENYIDKYNLNRNWFLYKNKNNLGYIQNFYRAISLCEEDFIFLCDQDDIWELDKIEKMSDIMKKENDILLLSSKYGIIDSHDETIHSILERNNQLDNSIKKIDMLDIMKAYRWPGMVMCIRKSFFDAIITSIQNSNIPHDLIFALLACENEGFYEYNYVGAFHRRHDNNVAREEHRIFKLLNLERKIKDISEMIDILQNIEDKKLLVHSTSIHLIEYKLNYLKRRKEYILHRRLIKIVALYYNDTHRMFRVISLLCDLWLIIFGDYKSIY